MEKSLFLAAILFTGTLQIHAAQPTELQPALAKLAAAKPGETVKLPAGTFAVDEIVVPSGVTLSGAGYDKTILMATGPFGLTIRNAVGTKVSDLSVRGAKGSGVVVEKSSDVTLSRVGIEGALTGLMVMDSSKVRAENLVLADNRTGAVFNGNTDSSVVNNTFNGNTALAMSIGVNKNSSVFNNLFVNSPLGVFVAPENDSLKLDYNIYQVSKLGKSADAPPDSVYSWRDQTGYDVHSLQQAVEFTAGADYIFKPDNVMSWSPDRVVTSGWGIPTLGTYAAPKTDIDGQAYAAAAGPGVGAWEVKVTAPRPADGKFTVKGAEGRSSAGIYTKDGILVTWLFNNLPLKQGTYSYWVPPRDLYGQPIPAGDYEFRTAQADLHFVPVGNGFAGNTGPGPKADTLAQLSNSQAIYDENNQIVIALGWNEGGINLRSMAPDFKSQNWWMPGTSNHVGVATDGKGAIYSLRDAAPNYVMMKLDGKTGQTLEILPGQFNHLIPIAQFSKDLGGMAALDGKLFLADTGANKLFITPVTDLDFKTSVDMPSPRSLNADPKHDWIWMLSGDNIVAVDNTGAVKLQIASPVATATSLSVRGDTIALLSEDTGNVQTFDISADPLKPVAKGQIEAEAKAFPHPIPPISRIALNDAGDVVVRFMNGMKVFGADGKLKNDFLGGWYNSFYIGLPQPDGTITAFDPTQLDRRVLFNVKDKMWKFNGNFDKQGHMLDMFTRDGKYYLFTTGIVDEQPPGTKLTVAPTPFYCISRIEGDKVVPLVAWIAQKGELSSTQDFSKPLNGPLDPAIWTPVLGPDGKPAMVRSPAFHADTNGDLVADIGFMVDRYPLTDFDAKGVPQYDWKMQTTTLTMGGPDGSPFRSPHTFEPAVNGTKGFGMAPNRVLSYYSDGGTPRLVDIPGGHMSGLTGNWAGTDLASFRKDGKMEWFQPLPEVNGTSGPYVVKDIVYGNGIISSETQIFDRDGLYLARLGQPKGIPWGGKWLDNSLQFHPFAGADGKQYMLYGDFNECCMFWFETTGLDKIIRQKQPLVISPTLATALAALPQPALPHLPAPPTTKITIKKLDAPMPIDGDMEKWRKALPVPQVIITPDTGTAAITGPQDCSALVRFAYEGTNLYVQVIKFDDVIVQFQDVAMCYKQDATEMAINSFGTGFKFNVAYTHDQGDVISRERFGTPGLSKLLDAASAPRKITVLENAESIPERKIIEALYNVDLSKSKVIVTEFKIPLDGTTYSGAEADAPTTKSGDSIYIGLMIDDNDYPGGDVQEFEVWPATYNTFSGKETAALATFE